MEMLYKKEFPDYDGELYVPEGFEDGSWHNDMCPKAVKKERRGDSEIMYMIFQDYRDANLREMPGGKRYLFEIDVNYEYVFGIETDDLEELDRFIKGIEVY